MLQQEQTKTRTTKIDLTDGTRFVGIAIFVHEHTLAKHVIFVTQSPSGEIVEERIPMPANAYLMYGPAVFLRSL